MIVAVINIDFATRPVQIVQEDGSALKELSVRGVGTDNPLALNQPQLSLGSLGSLSGLGSLNGLSLGNISLLGQAGLALQTGPGGLAAVANAVNNANCADKKNQKPFHCKLCTATFNRLGMLRCECLVGSFSIRIVHY